MGKSSGGIRNAGKNPRKNLTSEQSKEFHNAAALGLFNSAVGNSKGDENEVNQLLINKLFSEGYGKIKTFKLVEFGLTTEYIKNPNMSVSQLKKAPTYTIEASVSLREKAEKNRIKYEENNKPITILDFAKKVAKENRGKIIHKSKSGSVYISIAGKKIRISNHFILDRDAMNPKSRYDLEIVQREFTNNDKINLKNLL